jgi:hypothetical protein
MPAVVGIVSGGISIQTDNTVDSCFMLPILPHKIGNVRDFWDDVSEKFGSDTVDQFKGVGVRLALAFLQTMPQKGDFLIIFLRSADGLDTTLQEMFATDDEYSRYLTEQFKDFTGIDLSKEENVPNIELLLDWRDPHPYRDEKSMLKMPWCFAAPLLPGKTQDAVRMVKQGASRTADLEKMMRDHFICRNLSYIQHMDQGDFIVRHILASSPLDELLASFVSCNDAVCKRARDIAKEMTGLDYSDPDQQPHVELLFKWDEQHGFETADQIIAYTE